MHHPKTVPGIGHEWPVSSLTHQLAYRLTQCQMMTGGMHLRYL